MFAEFRRVPVFCVTEWCSVVSVPSFEGVFCESDVCFRSVIVVTFDGCLVDNWWLKAVSVKRACVLLSAVAWFVVNRVICGLSNRQDKMLLKTTTLTILFHGVSFHLAHPTTVQGCIWLENPDLDFENLNPDFPIEHEIRKWTSPPRNTSSGWISIKKSKSGLFGFPFLSFDWEIRKRIC